jgi:hypothetical protein
LTFLDENTVSVERLDEDVVRRVTVQGLLKTLLVKVVTAGSVARSMKRKRRRKKV